MRKLALLGAALGALLWPASAPAQFFDSSYGRSESEAGEYDAPESYGEEEQFRSDQPGMFGEDFFDEEPGMEAGFGEDGEAGLVEPGGEYDWESDDPALTGWLESEARRERAEDEAGSGELPPGHYDD